MVAIHMPEDMRALVTHIAVPVIGGALAGLALSGKIQTWYRKLKKPSWTPPDWLFGPVWTVLYILMGVASYYVWKQGGFTAQAFALTIYGISLLLNFLWTPLFFGLERPDLAMYDILALEGFIIATIVLFYDVIGDLVLPLLLPYLAWVTYAAALTIWIWYNNPVEVCAVPAKVAVD
eukprot:jgi/Chrzof1/4577/Cz14g18270.t1